MPETVWPQIRIFALQQDDQWTPLSEVEPTRQDVSWYVFARPEATLNPHLSALLRQHEHSRPEVDLFYGDEVIAGGSNGPWQYICKPEFDETQLIAQDYIGLPVAVRHGAMTELGGLPPPGPLQIYEMLLRARSKGLDIGRITEVLAVTPHAAPRVLVHDRLAVLRRALLPRRADCEVVPGLTATTAELRRRFDNPPHVTLIIPTNQSIGGAAKASRTAVPMVH